MRGVPALRRKAFLIQRLESPEPLRAYAEHCENPRYADLARAAPPADLHGIKLTLPDGSEWWVSDAQWENMLDLTRASRAHELAAA